VSFVITLLGLLALWWAAGYFVAYTADAYVDSTILSVAPEVSGRVDQVFVVDNQQVSQGSKLFSIDQTQLRLALQQAEDRVNVAEAQVTVDAADIESARANETTAAAALELAGATLARARSLAETGTSSRQALDVASSQKARALGDLAVAKATVSRALGTQNLHSMALASAKTDRKLAEWRLGRTSIVAPIAGQITNLKLGVGQTTAADTPALAVVAKNDWHIVANYKEYIVRRLSPGHPAWIWLDSNPWHFYRAHVDGIAHAIAREDGSNGLVPYVSPTVDWIRLSRRLPVRLVLDEPHPELFAGADARVIVFN
jgi:multidrug efflux system membrane fusion protein